jgi:hypothetical protein
MTRWRPGREWFVANTPRLVAIADRAAALEPLVPVVSRHFA